jgi:hypothetical protein
LRPREEELYLFVAPTEVVRLARRVLELDEQLMANEKQQDGDYLINGVSGGFF